MKIAVVGAGYAGLTLSCLAEKGNEINFIDIDEDKVEKINRGISPIYEPGLDEIISKHAGNRIKAYSNYTIAKECDVIFICVHTPSKLDGSIDLSYVFEASKEVAKAIKNSMKYNVIAIKSTVIPGTTLTLKPIIEEYSKKKVGENLGLCMNPEFLREGSAVKDFLNPDKIVIGYLDDGSKDAMLELFNWIDPKVPRILTDPNTAEMIKYAQNAALACRISFINEIANICEKFNVDVKEVAKAIGLDPRIGPHFLNAGIGFGGSCLGKDLRALIRAAEQKGYEANLLKKVLELNEIQPFRIVELLKEHFGSIENRTFALLGLAFKGDTDDVRDSPAIKIALELKNQGVKVKVYDPKAMDNAKKILKDSVQYCKSIDECLKGSEACIIATDWKDFKEFDFSKYKIPIFDGRRILDPEKTKIQGIEYKGIGWKWNTKIQN